MAAALKRFEQLVGQNEKAALAVAAEFGTHVPDA